MNRTSNIEVRAETRKKGRAVTDIRFLIAENKQLAMFDIDDGEGIRASEVYARLRQVGVSDRLARQWIAAHGEDYVVQKLDYVQGQGDVQSPVKYLAAALRDDYEREPEAEPSAEAVALAERRVAQAQAQDAREEARRAAQVARAKKFAQVALAAAARNPTQRDSDKRLFMDRLEDEIAREDFRAYGWGSVVNASAIFAFWEEMSPDVFDG